MMKASTTSTASSPFLLRSRATRVAEKVLTRTAMAVWPLVTKYNRAFERPAVHPKWAPAPLLKRKERTYPEFGWPRETDSLCPKCVKEVRSSILSGERDIRTLIDGKPGEVKATILEEDGQLK